MIQGAVVMTDSTLFQANAFLDSMVPRDKKIEIKLEKNKVVPGISPPKGRKITNENYISKTDPDASLAFKKGAAKTLKYKNHLTIDSNSRIILDTKVTTGSTHESQVYLNQIDTIEKEISIKIKVTIADRAYASGNIIQKLLDQNIKPNIPLFSNSSGKRDLEKEGFFYNKESNHYTCSQGAILTPYPSIRYGIIKTFHTEEGVCNNCRIERICTAARFKYTKVRRIPHNIHKELFQMVKKEMLNHEFRKNLSDRLWKLEGLMSELKLRHNMNRAKYRGINKVQIQDYMAAYVINIKRIIAYIFISIFIANLFRSYLKWNTKKCTLVGFSTGRTVCWKIL